MLACRSTLLLCFILYFKTSVGQDVDQHQAAGNITSVYTSNLGLNARLYNGPEYLDYSNTVKLGFPYFDSKNYQVGSLVFDSIFYPGLQLRLDLVNDYLMILHPLSFVSMQLRNETISAFTIGSHQFFHLGTDSGSAIKNGFYERVYNGNTSVYVKHRKVLEDRNKSDDIYQEAVLVDTYFVLKNNEFYQVKSMKGLLAIFKGKEKTIQQHLRQQKIRFKKNNQLAIVQSATFYDQLTK